MSSRQMPSLNALRAFEAVVRLRSFARAAQELHVTPAAISQLVRQLETHVGTTLLQRGGKQLAPSVAALAAMPDLSLGFDTLARAVDRLRPEDNGNNGVLALSAPPVFASRWLVHRLDDFHTHNPNFELRLLVTRRLVDFTTEDIDIGLRFGRGSYPGLYCERLMPETVVLVAAPALAATLTSVHDLLRCALLNDDAQSFDPSMPDWPDWLMLQGVPVEHGLRTRSMGDINLVIEAAMNGLGVARVWRSLVQNELRRGGLIQLFDMVQPIDRAYHLVMPEQRLKWPKVAAFRHWLQSQAN